MEKENSDTITASVKVIEAEIERIKKVATKEQEKLLEERKKFEEEKREFLKWRSQIQELGKAQAEKVKLDVGGQYFATNRSTLCKQPGSMLEAMFSSRNADISKPDSEGKHWIDRDPIHFRTILNFLRTGVPVVPRDEREEKELMVESDYFQIQGLLDSGIERKYGIDTMWGKGWNILLKAQGQDLCFSSKCWNTKQLLNENDTSLNLNQSAKYPAFNDLPINELLIICGSRIVHLSLPTKKPLLEFFAAGKVVLLQRIAGVETPTELLTGDKFLESYYQPIWRLNSWISNRGFKIGGWFHQTWGSYGSDGIGETSAEWSGFGLEDNNWQPVVYGRKSCGTRKAHDYAGNAESKAFIFGR